VASPVHVFVPMRLVTLVLRALKSEVVVYVPVLEGSV
jgi:hypothetical protein